MKILLLTALYDTLHTIVHTQLQPNPPYHSPYTITAYHRNKALHLLSRFNISTHIPYCPVAYAKCYVFLAEAAMKRERILKKQLSQTRNMRQRQKIVTTIGTLKTIQDCHWETLFKAVQAGYVDVMTFLKDWIPRHEAIQSIPVGICMAYAALLHNDSQKNAGQYSDFLTFFDSYWSHCNTDTYSLRSVESHVATYRFTNERSYKEFPLFPDKGLLYLVIEWEKRGVRLENIARTINILELDYEDTYVQTHFRMLKKIIRPSFLFQNISKIMGIYHLYFVSLLQQWGPFSLNDITMLTAHIQEPVERLDALCSCMGLVESHERSSLFDLILHITDTNHTLLTHRKFTTFLKKYFYDHLVTEDHKKLWDVFSRHRAKPGDEMVAILALCAIAAGDTEAISHFICFIAETPDEIHRFYDFEIDYITKALDRYGYNNDFHVLSHAHNTAARCAVATALLHKEGPDAALQYCITPPSPADTPLFAPFVSLCVTLTTLPAHQANAHQIFHDNSHHFSMSYEEQLQSIVMEAQFLFTDGYRALLRNALPKLTIDRHFFSKILTPYIETVTTDNNGEEIVPIIRYITALPLIIERYFDQVLNLTYKVQDKSPEAHALLISSFMTYYTAHRATLHPYQQLSLAFTLEKTGKQPLATTLYATLPFEDCIRSFRMVHKIEQLIESRICATQVQSKNNTIYQQCFISLLGLEGAQSDQISYMADTARKLYHILSKSSALKIIDAYPHHFIAPVFSYLYNDFPSAYTSCVFLFDINEYDAAFHLCLRRILPTRTLDTWARENIYSKSLMTQSNLSDKQFWRRIKAITSPFIYADTVEKFLGENPDRSTSPQALTFLNTWGASRTWLIEAVMQNSSIVDSNPQLKSIVQNKAKFITIDPVDISLEECTTEMLEHEYTSPISRFERDILGNTLFERYLHEMNFLKAFSLLYFDTSHAMWRQQERLLEKMAQAQQYTSLYTLFDRHPFWIESSHWETVVGELLNTNIKMAESFIQLLSREDYRGIRIQCLFQIVRFLLIEDNRHKAKDIITDFDALEKRYVIRELSYNYATRQDYAQFSEFFSLLLPLDNDSITRIPQLWGSIKDNAWNNELRILEDEIVRFFFVQEDYRTTPTDLLNVIGQIMALSGNKHFIKKILIRVSLKTPLSDFSYCCTHLYEHLTFKQGAPEAHATIFRAILSLKNMSGYQRILLLQHLNLLASMNTKLFFKTMEKVPAQFQNILYEVEHIQIGVKSHVTQFARYIKNCTWDTASKTLYVRRIVADIEIHSPELYDHARSALFEYLP